MNLTEKNTDLYIEGTDLGILIYFIGWFTVGIIFTFSSNPYVKNIIDFYVYYDVMALCFVALHFILHRYHSNDGYVFLNFKAFKVSDFFRGLAMVIFSFLILLILNFIIGLIFIYTGSINDYNLGTRALLSIARMVPTEELVFRGLILIIIFLIFNNVFKLGSKIAGIISILASGIFFGAIHYFRYVKPYGDSPPPSAYQPLLYLTILGILCGFLALKEGLWTACLLHMINNLIAIFGAGLSLGYVSQQFDYESIAFLAGFIAATVIVYLILSHSEIISINVGYLFFSTILFFIFGYYTNSLISSEDFGGLWFEHAHAIFFVPLLFLIVRKRKGSNELLGFFVGSCFGLFISDYYDIINFTVAQWAITGFYAISFALIYNFIYFYIKIREKKLVLNNV